VDVPAENILLAKLLGTVFLTERLEFLADCFKHDPRPQHLMMKFLLLRTETAMSGLFFLKGRTPFGRKTLHNTFLTNSQTHLCSES